MRKTATILVAFILLFSCTQKPAPITQAADPSERLAVAIQYVGAPQVNVYTTPDLNAAVDIVYRYGETVSVLSFKGDWAEVRTSRGSGWVPRNDLMTAEAMKQLVESQVPRFLTPPAAIPSARHGQITMQAKVNTDGEVIQVTPVGNTTGDNQLALENANALLNARFYPMVQKGQRFTFTYEHKVYY